MAAPAGGGSPIANVIAHGYGYATYAKADVETDIEGPTLNPNVNIARKLRAGARARTNRQPMTGVRSPRGRGA